MIKMITRKWGLTALVLAAGASLAGCELMRSRDGGVAPGTVVLNKGIPLETEHNQLVNIKREYRGVDYDYKVLFGPYPPGEKRTGRGEFRNPEPQWHVWNGYVFAWGWWPIVTTTRVKAVTEGTTLVIQVGDTWDRVFLLDPASSTSVRVELIDNPAVFKTLTTESFVQADVAGDGVTLQDPEPIPGTGEIADFIAYVRQLARSGGYEGGD